MMFTSALRTVDAAASNSAFNCACDFAWGAGFVGAETGVATGTDEAVGVDFLNVEAVFSGAGIF